MKKGIYEEVISSSLSHELESLEDHQKYVQEIDNEEASGILASYTAKVIRKQLDGIRKLEDKVAFVNSLLGSLPEQTVDSSASQLLAVADRKDPRLIRGTAKDLPRPETSLAQSSLFTGSRNEPALFAEFRKEIPTCNRIDMLVSFIRWSGLIKILDELKDFTRSGGILRVVTTSYMGATEVRAIEELQKLPNTEIRISYDTKATRLHAKAYVFRRDTGFDTAYVGSSNLTNPAISSGLEWNTKITRQDQPEMMDKIHATFDTYWNSPDFESYDGDSSRLRMALQAEKGQPKTADRKYLLDIHPYVYQQKILDALDAERKLRNCRRNLVVAATGTGKTVIGALDYKRFRQEHPENDRLLFIAHRKEILEQALEKFREVLKDPNFGDLCVGNDIPDQFDYVFMSIQTFQSRRLWEYMEPDHYGYILCDEFHHAAADSYQALFTHFQPEIFLGLTATPERMDGQDILVCFNGRIAAEIRLPEAIERRLLVPFEYFGISDSQVSLQNVAWKNGRYDAKELSDLYVHNRLRDDLILTSLEKYIPDLEEVKGLGFCVSQAHAASMASYFSEYGVPSLALTSLSGAQERETARKRLLSGDIRFIFTVDLYNEGVDIPEINTVLFLRPTESLTVFLQQLGRGLRHAPGKECLRVLDFIAASNRHYNFEQKFQALLLSQDRSVRREVENGFSGVPSGCYIQLEKMASRYILDNLQYSFQSRRDMISRLRSFEQDSGLPLNLENFLRFHGLTLQQVYRFGSFYKLQEAAGLREPVQEPLDPEFSKAFLKISYADSPAWISFLKRLPDPGVQTEPEKRMLEMFWRTLFPQKSPDALQKQQLFQCPVILEELQELLEACRNRIGLIPVSCPGTPLEIGAVYNREQLFTALGVSNPETIREGVKWIREEETDVLLVTLNKAEKDYSPTTLYQDYAISQSLFHWQSQSTTSEDSPTGQRYIHHDELGSKVLLFVRRYKKENGIAAPYTFLGPVHYVSHTGSRPMSVTWKMEYPIPACFLENMDLLN